MLASIERQAAPLESDGAWLLLAELNHRIGNELQVALSALRLAKRGLACGEPVRFIEDAVVRLESFGDVHQLLDRQRGQGPLAQRLEALCRATSLFKAAALGIHLTLKLEDVTADEETAWTVCVVASELMTNVFKHAFPGGLPGVVGVALRQDEQGVLLTVSDNGVGANVGCRSGETIWQAPGFGSGIVIQLAERLGGFVTRVGGPTGTTATFWAPAAKSMR
jgi:two-component sensor histidine kinase